MLSEREIPSWQRIENRKQPFKKWQCPSRWCGNIHAKVVKEIYGWSSIQTYVFAIHKDSGKSLPKIREEYMHKKVEEID